MKVSNGVDIIEISRIKKDIEESGNKFLKRIYTDKEIQYCEARGKQKYNSYAGKFAGKEAIYKALSEYISFDYSWTDFEILNNEKGKPYIKLKVNIENLEKIEISISHCKEYAVANAIAIFKI